MIKNKPNSKFWTELKVLKNGKIKVIRANKLVKLNQFKRTWKPTVSREIARLLNRSRLVIN